MPLLEQVAEMVRLTQQFSLTGCCCCGNLRRTLPKLREVVEALMTCSSLPSVYLDKHVRPLVDDALTPMKES